MEPNKNDPVETIHAEMHRLNCFLYGQDWFAKKVLKDPLAPRTVIVYVHFMTKEVLEEIPRTYEGYNVKVHYISSAPLEPKPVVSPFANIPLYVAPVAKLLEEEPVFTKALDVHNELWKLRRECGKINLEDIFFEIHDGVNAVTEKSSEYPEVRAALQKLYDEVGFDIICEDLELD